MTHRIECKWRKNNKVLINPDGQVFPCCYLANFMFMTEKEKWKQIHAKQPIMQEYEKNKEDLNLNNKTMPEILSHDWFDKTLVESWYKEETTLMQCERFCKVEERN